MDNRSSSPDPLAESFNDNSKMSTRPRSRSRSISDTISQKPFVLSDEVHMSPSKTVTEQSLSPWRIRVTVEAEPEDAALDNKDSHENELKRRTITQTMKVPLRDNSDSPTKPRKSSPARSSASRARRSNSPSKRRPSVTDLNAIVLGDDGDEDEWTGKPIRTRRRWNSSSAGKRKSADSRKSTEAAEFEIREDEPAIEKAIEVSDAEDSPIRSQSPELREIDLNRVAMRSRGGSIRKDKDKESLADGFRKVSVNSMMSYPTPSPTASEHENSDDKQDDLDDMPVGMDTVMESEGFTMIDLDSLPSVKHLRSSPIESHDEESDEIPIHRGSHATIHQPQVAAAAPAINLSVVQEESFSDLEHHLPSSPPKHSPTEEDERSSYLSSAPSYTVGHLQLPSSTNVQRSRHVTPMPLPTCSSPKLPSPPRQAQVAKERSPASAEKAVRAGVALQSAMDPLVLEGATPHQGRGEANLFEGFSSGTTRELRAGLRFGEELAKKPMRDLPKANRKDDQAPEQLACKERSVELRVQDDKVWQQRRDDVIRRATESQQTITVADDESAAEDSTEEEIVAVDETLGDIWLAAAKKTPKPEQKQPRKTSNTPSNSQPIDGPRRKLIPSPWKRGEQIEAPDLSTLTADTSMSGLFWKQSDSSGSGHRFGEEILAQPSRLAVLRAQDYPRRVSGESANLDPLSQNDDLVEPHIDIAQDDFEWRDATEVVDEETNELEAEKELNNMTHLHETNLEDIPEQDMTYPVLKTLKFQHYDPNKEDDDDIQAAVSKESSHSEVEQYRQRTSLSPSKERPNTPRSALKGGRLSLGAHPRFELADDNLGDKKVAWARRSTCMNEDWEESTRSVRSSQEDTIDKTPTPVASERVEHKDDKLQNNSKASSESEPKQKKGWFSWMHKDNTAKDQNIETNPVVSESLVAGLDGSADDDEGETGTSFIPTSKHDHAHGADTIVVKTAPSSSASLGTPPSFKQSKTPSYLLPPSYPSDPTRNSKIALSTSGVFSKTHMRTMHIIYAKSRKPRFHGPAYPNEVRGEVRQLVESGWKLEIDESKSFLGEVFTFKIGSTEATVLERFMREVEHGYNREDVAWGWSAVDLAGWLGRVAVGEVVRAEEKAAKS